MARPAGIVRRFDEDGGLDLTSHDLSMAVKFGSLVEGNIHVEFFAPTADHILYSDHFIPPFFNGWTRIDLGYSQKSGDPRLKSVQALRIILDAGIVSQSTTITVDDLRLHPKPKTGKVTFLFDAQPATYTEAFPQLNRRGWQGSVVDYIPTVDKPADLSIEQLRRLSDADWDVLPRPSIPESWSNYFIKLPLKQQEQQIRQAKRALERKGFSQGARHVVGPVPIGNETIELLQTYHETAYGPGAAPNNAGHPANMYDLSYSPFHNHLSYPYLVGLAAEFKQLITLSYSLSNMELDTFEHHLATIEKKDVEIVSPSQFLDSIET